MLTLSLPFPKRMTSVHGVSFWWQCRTAQFCPNSCTQGYHGFCGTSANFECMCFGWTSAKLWTVLNSSLSTVVSLFLTMTNVRGYLRNSSFMTAGPCRPRVTLAAQFVLSFISPMMQLVYLAFLATSQLKCLKSYDVAVIILPGFLFALMANDVKRALRTWTPEIVDYSALWSDELLLAVRPIAACGSAVVSGLCIARSVECWGQAVECHGAILCWSICAVLNALGVFAAIAIGPVANKRD